MPAKFNITMMPDVHAFSNAHAAPEREANSSRKKHSNPTPVSLAKAIDIKEKTIYMTEIPTYIKEIAIYMTEIPTYIKEITIYMTEIPTYIKEITIYMTEIPTYIKEKTISTKEITIFFAE